MLVFSTQLCELLPTFCKVKVQYIQTVCGWGGMGGGGAGMLSCVGDHILQEFNIVFLTRFRTYKNCFTTPNKNLGGEGGLRHIYTCRKVPLQVNFFK
jgi:hypothetical protein